MQKMTGMPRSLVGKFLSHGASWSLLVLLVATVGACGDDSPGDGPDGGVSDANPDPNAPDANPDPNAPDANPDPNAPDASPDPNAPDASPDPNAPDAGPGAISFADIRCIPDPASEQIVEGQNVSCQFRVEGPAGTEVTLSCEDDAGDPVDCSAASSTQIQPFGSNALPIDDGRFEMPTDGLAGTTAIVVWVADDGTNRYRSRFEAPVVADNPQDGPPSVVFDCGGDTDGTVSVAAGNTLACSVGFRDPDPDTLTWSYTVAAGGTPVNEPTPFGGAGPAPFNVNWSWVTAGSEAGTSRTFSFRVNDGTGANVVRNLVVTVAQ